MPADLYSLKSATGHIAKHSGRIVMLSQRRFLFVCIRKRYCTVLSSLEDVTSRRLNWNFLVNSKYTKSYWHSCLISPDKISCIFIVRIIHLKTSLNSILANISSCFFCKPTIFTASSSCIFECLIKGSRPYVRFQVDDDIQVVVVFPAQILTSISMNRAAWSKLKALCTFAPLHNSFN